MNNIIYFNQAYGDPNWSGAVNLNYSCSPETLSGTGNLTGDPLFVNGPAYNFNLQAASPCIDTGDPSSPLDPDGSRADMGALYYLHGLPQLDVTMTPINPPLQVPANGGSFQFNASVINHGPNQAPFVVWGRIKNPDGTYTATLLGPVTINPPVNVTVTRQRTQNVPGSWAAGVYTYLGYANWTNSYPALDSSFFTFTKMTAGSGPYVWDANCYGEPFPGEEAISGQPSAFSLMGSSPNPFNAVTTISFELRAASDVRLTVYDTSGRLVATLVNGWRNAGSQEVAFNGSKFSSGIYLVRLSSEHNVQSLKLALLK